MNRISKLLTLLVLFSFGLATENNKKETAENAVSVKENKSDDASVNEEKPAIDIERVSQVRQTKAVLDNKHAQRVRHIVKESQKSEDGSKSMTMSESDMIQKIKKSMGVPFQKVQIKNINGERVVELPNAKETN
ncbi:MAG: hypothetical protein CMG41_04915 [Candidatus Marinimicrobia bacterium]|nr:hypothetical protein [Candidatus Neomarinimicrobiota bacterium]|tara:strand:- start:12541 stop:12942 length:402 start_codon:yes stop_codon:yes gene_type:complete